MSSVSRKILLAAVFGTTVLSAFASGGQSGSRTLWLRLDPAATRPVGEEFARSIQFDRKSKTVKLELTPGISVERAAEYLARRREVMEIRGARGVLFTHRHDLRSLSALSSRIRQMEGGRDETPRARFGEEEEEGAGTEYLRALRDYLRVRVYPYDRLDSNAYDRAVVQAAQMKAAVIGTASQDSSTSNQFQMAGVPGISGKWKFVGPNNLNTPYQIYYGVRPSSGRVNAIVYNPVDTKTIYVGAPQGGVMKSTDGGKTWAALGDFWGYNTVSALAVDPKNPETVYAGTGDFQGLVPAYTMGIMKTTDGGKTWTNVGKSSFGTSAVSAIALDPASPNTIIVTTGRGPDGNGRVWRSTDGGNTWAASIAVNANWTSVSYAAADSSGKRSVYAVGNGVLYRSDNSGATWTKLTSPAKSDNFALPYIAGSGVDSKTAYLLSTADQKIYKTTDSGGNWTDITGSFPGGYNWSQGFYDWYIACYKDGSADHLFVGLIDVVESPDGGTTWKSVGSTYTSGARTHNDQHSFAANPQNPQEVLIGNDGGLYKATGGSGNWTITGLSDTLGITQFYNVVWHPTDKTRILGGTQDNASPVSLGNLAKWENVGGGDGGFCAINPADPRIQFVTIYGFTVIMTKDSWAKQIDISPQANGDQLPFVTPIYQDPVNTRYLYGCTNYLWRFDIQTNSWTPRLGGTQLSNGSLIHSVAVAPTDGNVIYTGSDDGRLFMSTNGGSSWRNITGSLPNRAITSIVVSKTNSKEILVSLSGTGTAHVYMCSDTSAGTPVYVSKAGSGKGMLPDIPANCIERDPYKPDTTWYVGTDIGVFSTGDGGISWANATAPLGLPNVQVNSLFASGKLGTLNAGTYGRGVWSITLGQSADAGLLPPSAYGIYTGTRFSGDVGSLAKDDNNNLIVNSAKLTSYGQVAAASSTFTIGGTGTLQKASFEVSLYSNTKATQQVYVKNWRLNRYELLKTLTGTAARTTATVDVVGSQMSDYMSSGRKVEIIVRAAVPAALGNSPFKLYIDRTSADIITGG